MADDISPAAAAIGARLARLRKDRGMTQMELADKVAVSQPMISDYERGALRLHGELILQLMAILDVTADELLGAVGKPDKRTAERARNRRLYRAAWRAPALPRRDQDRSCAPSTPTSIACPTTRQPRPPRPALIFLQSTHRSQMAPIRRR